MAGDDGTATPSQAPTTISPTHIEETIFKIVEGTDAPSYAPTPVSFAPTHFALGPWSSVATEHGCDCREFATSECKGACSHLSLIHI